MTQTTDTNSVLKSSHICRIQFDLAFSFSFFSSERFFKQTNSRQFTPPKLNHRLFPKEKLIGIGCDFSPFKEGDYELDSISVGKAHHQEGRKGKEGRDERREGSRWDGKRRRTGERV